MARYRNKKKPPTLPDGCGYQGHEFGAQYLDSQCFGGRLYDMDNGDGDLIFEPDEYLHCPNCRMEEWLENQQEHIGSRIRHLEKSSLPHWHRVCRFVLKTNHDEAIRLLTGRFRVVKYVEFNEADYCFIDREWTFDADAIEFPPQ